MEVTYDLTCWYLNARRITELIGRVPHTPFSASDALAELTNLKNAIVEWMRKNKPSPLEVLLAQGKLSPGALFTHHSDFYFSGLSRVAQAHRNNKPVKLATAYSKLDEWQLEFDFHHEHLTSNSSWSQLSGRKRVFVLGVVTDIQVNKIKCAPYVIANIVDPSTSLPGFSGIWHNHLEVYVNQIDSFSDVETVKERLTKASLLPLRGISEADIKAALAEIINEPTVPKDWSGEASDLFSSRVILDGQRVSAAFLLKGPAKFRPLMPADLGKNGDQIGRLFDEPADLFVLQHCHEVKPPVRKQMRAYAEQMGRPRRFCIIDGYDTIRILRAYRKCGLAFENASASQP